MALNRELVGKTYPEGTHEVTREWVERFARAANDENPRYFGSDVVAPPLWHAAPGFPHSYQVSRDPELGVDYARVVHIEEEHVIHRPTRVGDFVRIAAFLHSVEDGEYGSSYTVGASVRGLNDEVFADIKARMFILGSGPGYKPAWSAPADPPAFEETTMVDEDQPHRWAEVTGDDNPIHLDRKAARKAGLRGAVLHGMCTMTIASNAAVNGPAGGDPARIAYVGCRFSWPVFPPEPVTTRFWPFESSAPDHVAFGFETYNSKGKAVITDGRVEVLP